MNLIKELTAWLRFFFGTPTQEKSIVFYSEHESYWAYFEGLVLGLQRDMDIPFCYITSDPDDPVLRRKDPKLHAFYLNRLLPFFMLFVKCRVFVITMTELDRLHLKRSIHSVHYVYVFHSLNSVHMAYQHRAFDHYDSILCCGAYQIREIRRDESLRNLPKKELIEGGYYRVERIYREAQRLGSSAENSPKCILIAPSWAAHNLLAEHGISLAERLLEAGYALILRPHPETNKRHPELVNTFAAHFRSNDRVSIERSVTSDESLLRADVLITDWSGIAQEYAFGTERPVLYLDVPRKVHNDHYKELGIEPFEAKLRSEVGIVVSTTDIPKIAIFVERLLLERELYQGRIRELREKNLFCFGKAGEVGANHILDVASRNESSTRNAA